MFSLLKTDMKNKGVFIAEPPKEISLKGHLERQNISMENEDKDEKERSHQRSSDQSTRL